MQFVEWIIGYQHGIMMELEREWTCQLSWCNYQYEFGLNPFGQKGKFSLVRNNYVRWKQVLVVVVVVDELKNRRRVYVDLRQSGGGL